MSKRIFPLLLLSSLQATALAEDFRFMTPDFPGGESAVSSMPGPKNGALRSHGDANSSSAYGGMPSSDAMLTGEAWTVSKSRASGTAGAPSSSGGAGEVVDLVDNRVNGTPTTIFDEQGNPVQVYMSADGQTMTYPNGYTVSVANLPGMSGAEVAGAAGGTYNDSGAGIGVVSGVDAGMVTSLSVAAQQRQAAVSGLVSALHFMRRDEAQLSDPNRLDAYMSSVSSMQTAVSMMRNQNFGADVNALCDEHMNVLSALMQMREYQKAADAVAAAQSSDNGRATAAQKARLAQMEAIVMPAKARNEAIVQEQVALAGLSMPVEIAKIESGFAAGSIVSLAMSFADSRVEPAPQPTMRAVFDPVTGLPVVDSDTGEPVMEVYTPPYNPNPALEEQRHIARRMLVVSISLADHPADHTLPMLLQYLEEYTKEMMQSESSQVRDVAIKHNGDVIQTRGKTDTGAKLSSSMLDTLMKDAWDELRQAGLDPQTETTAYLNTRTALGAASSPNSCNALTAIATPWVCATSWF